MGSVGKMKPLDSKQSLVGKVVFIQQYLFTS